MIQNTSVRRPHKTHLTTLYFITLEPTNKKTYIIPCLFHHPKHLVNTSSLSQGGKGMLVQMNILA
jgi:hypothetical protein